MAFDVSLLPAYVDQNRLPLLRKAIFGGKTIGLLQKQLDVKSASALNIIDDSVYFQEGEGCTYTPSGSTTFSQRNITTGKIKVQKEFCLDDLEPKYTQFLLNAGALQDGMAGSFEETLIEGQLREINKKMEIAVWQGNTASANGDLNQFDGLIKVVSGATGYVTGNSATYGTTYTSITAANVIAVLQQVYAAIPEDILQDEDTVIMVGTDVYRLFVQALTNANMYHYVSDGTRRDMEFILPGTDIRVIGLFGLSGTRVIMSGKLNNFFYGTDLMNDWEKFQVYYDPKTQSFSFLAKWRSGVQVAFPDQIVYFKY
jgi:hypothetical protein